jgi:hypothetical protein
MQIDFNVRAAAILTGSYVAGTVISSTTIPVGYLNQLMVYVDFTKGSLDSAQLKVEFSPNGVNYYQETFSSVLSGTATESVGEHAFTATGAYRLAIPIKDRFVKISVKGTGTATGSSMAIKAVAGLV